MAQNAGLVAVTPSDTTVFSPPLKRIYVGVTGNVAVVDAFGNAATFEAAPVGWLEFPNTPIAKIMETGTSATNLVGDSNASR